MLPLALAAVIVGCAVAVAAAPEGESDGAVTDPSSPVARKISDLFWIITVIAAVVGVGVQAAIVWVILSSRKRAAEEEAGQDTKAGGSEAAEHVPDDGQPREGVFRPRHHGDPRVEKVLFVITLAVFIGIGVASYVVLLDIEEPDRPVDIEVEVIAHQWFWEFHYPQPRYNVTDVGRIAELHAPVDATVGLKITASDVLHSAWIPDLGVKVDAVPGTINTFWFRAEKEGTYLLQCAEFCGSAHSDMRAVVVIESQAEFDAWVAAKQEAARPAPETPLVEGGVFNITLEPSGPVPAAIDIIDGADVSFRVRNNLSVPSSLAFSAPYAGTPGPPVAPGGVGWLNLTFDTPVTNGTYSCTGCAADGAFNTTRGARVVEIHLRQTPGSFGFWSIFPEEVVAEPGEVLQFHIFNDAVPGQGTTHNFTIGIFGEEVLFAAEGIGTKATLEPGENMVSDRFVVPDTSKEYWCDVLGHYGTGMRGVLTVGGGAPPPPPASLPEENVPGFEAAFAPLALLAAASAVALRRRK